MVLNRNRVRSYTFSEFRVEYDKKDMVLVERIIENIKTNKVLYARVVFMTAMLIHANQNVYASNNFEDSLNEAGNTMIDLFLVAARWSSIGMGFKAMITTLLSGGNMKNAINEGIQYLLAFLFFQLYPQIFTILRGIKF